MQRALDLSVVVITKNEAGRLAECLDSARWAGEIVVVDDESTDETLSVAGRYTDRLIRRKMDVEGRHRNFAYAQARHEWVFSLDADERFTPELQSEIIGLLQGNPPCDGYTVPRKNHLGRHWIRHGGWYPSRQLKLFRKEKFRYEESEVHPRAFMNSPCGELSGDLIHHSYRDLGDFLAKMNRQSTLEAQKWIRDARPMGLGKALFRSIDRFVRTLLFKKGYKDGFVGYLVAVYAGLYQLLSFAKYWHRKHPQETGSPGGGEAPPRWAATRLAGLSVVILTKNAAATLPACLDSVSWAQEVIVVDGGSTDGTLELARAVGATVLVDTTADDFGHLRNRGTDQCQGTWVLQLDADEVVTPAFREALEKIVREPQEHSAYKFRRRNKFLGRWMRHGGWDHHSLHLFRRGLARYQGRVHERLLAQGSIGTLNVGVEHTPFRSIEEFVDRQNRYTTLQARGLRETLGAVSMKTIWWQTTGRPVKLFWKMFVKKQGFREGRVGGLFSALFAFVHFLKWAKLWEILDAERTL